MEPLRGPGFLKALLHVEDAVLIIQRGIGGLSNKRCFAHCEGGVFVVLTSYPLFSLASTGIVLRQHMRSSIDFLRRGDR